MADRICSVVCAVRLESAPHDQMIQVPELWRVKRETLLMDDASAQHTQHKM